MSINLDETDDFSLKFKKKATGVKVIFYLNNKK